MSVDFSQINAQPTDPYPIAVGTKQVAVLNGKVYVAQSNGWLLVLNPVTNSLDDFVHLTPISGGTSLALSAMTARGGALWVMGWSSFGNIDLALYRVYENGTADKHAVWDNANVVRNVLSLNEDPIDEALYFVTDNLPSSGAYGVVRYNITPGTFETIIDADQMIVDPIRAVGHGPGYQIRDAAVFSDQSIVFVGNQRNDTNDASAAAHYGRPFGAWTSPASGKPAAGTTAISLNWYEPPLTHAALGLSWYCVPNTVTVDNDDIPYFTWQVDSVTG